MSKLSSYSDFITAYKTIARVEIVDVADELLLRDSFRRNLRYALHACAWPEHVVIEEREWSSGGVIPYAETDKQTIDTVWDIYVSDPTSLPIPKPLRSIPVPTGWRPLYTTGSATTSLWVKYLPEYTPWTGNAYDAGTAYSEGQVVQYGSDFYEALSTTTGNAPTNTQYWTLKQFSYRLVDFLAQAAYTDVFLSADKDEYLAGMIKARSFLATEQFTLSRGNASLAPVVFTNNSQQKRR